MRILHTSDWHLGRLFHGASRHDEQVQAMDRVVDLVGEAEVDLVVIAGDLYDRAIPPADAVELFDSTLVRLHEAGASVVAISGNHDSAVRVGYADRLLSTVGVTVRGATARAAEPVEIPTTDGGPPVVVYPVPFLDPMAVARLGRDGPMPSCRFSHYEAMAWAMDRVRTDLAGRRGARSVVVAHTFVTGAIPSDSERELSVGSVDRVDLDLFDGFDYVALGHLHQSQAWQGGRIAYSGTPLAYSFSEQHHTKSVRIVELGAGGGCTVDDVPLGVGRPLRTLRGEIDTLLTDPNLVAAERAWVRAILTDRYLPLQAMARLQARFPHAVELRHEPPVAAGGAAPAATDRPDPRVTDPFELSLRFLDEHRQFATERIERELLARAFQAVSQAEIA